MGRVVELRREDELEAHRLAWNALWRQTPGAGFCQTLDWLLAYLRSEMPADAAAHVELVYDDEGRLAGIVPLVVRTERTPLGKLRVLTFPLGLGQGLFTPLTRQPTFVMLRALEHAARRPADWEVMDLPGIDVDGSDHGRTASALFYAGLEATIEPWRLHAVAELEWGDRYWESRDRRMLGRIAHLEKKLRRRGEVEYVRYRPAGAMLGQDDPRWDLYGDAMRIALGTWQATADDGLTLCSPAHCELFRRAHTAAAHAGALDLNLLYVDREPVAFAYNYAVDGVVTTLAAGYDRCYADCGPGTLLTRALLRDGCLRGDRRVDFGGGALHATRPWATRLVTVSRARHYPRRALKAQALRWGRALGKRWRSAQ